MFKFMALCIKLKIVYIYILFIIKTPFIVKNVSLPALTIVFVYFAFL